VEATATTDLDEAEALYRAGRYVETADKLAALVAMELPEGELARPYGRAAALLARTYANLGRLRDALLWSEKAIAAAKLDPVLHYLRATIFQELGEPEEAIASLRRAIYLDHGFALAHFALGNLALKLGKNREADRHFSNTLELLRTHSAVEPLDGAEGISVARLTEIVAALRKSN
jgi:chemotaxis protein methyltransferase CheR